MKRTLLATAAAVAVLGLAARAPAGSMTIGAGSSGDLGTGSVDLGCADIDVQGTFSAGAVAATGGRDVTIAPSGVLNGNSATLEVAGDWDNAGSFNAGASTVELVDGCGLLSAVVAGNTSFHDLSMSTAAAKQVSFTAGSTQTVTGVLALSGATGQLLQMRSTVNGEDAFLDVQGTGSGDFVDVEGINALPGNNIALGSNSVKGPNTPGFLLTPLIPLLPPLALAVLAVSLLSFTRLRQTR